MNLNLNAAKEITYENNFEIPAVQTDGVSNQDETVWINTKASTYWGWFTQNPKVKNAVLMLSTWITGMGWTADTATQVRLEQIKGYGKDTMKNILFNLQCCRCIFGDSFFEIIRDKETHIVINLKPIDNQAMRIVRNKSGMIIRYEQTSKLPGKDVVLKFKPEEIFHVKNNGLVDQIHGISDLEALEKVITGDSQLFDVLSKVVNFQARPFIVFKLKTDDVPKRDAFIAKLKKIRAEGDDMYIPDDENLLSYEVVQVNPSQILMEWRADITNEFYRSFGLPQIIASASGQGTESEAKVIFYAFSQVVRHHQIDIEQQIWEQLGIRIKLNLPKSIDELLAIDQQKDSTNVLNVQPSELNPTSSNQS